MKLNQRIDLLAEQRYLSGEGYRAILECRDNESCEYLHKRARDVAQSNFGRDIFIRGLIEITNRCHNNCYYCGIRASNREVVRYSLSKEQILDSCQIGYKLGFRTFVLQGGENLSLSEEWLVDLIGSIRNTYPEAAITLSLGEATKELYKKLFEAGANRYLLRHESRNVEHYKQLHPSTMSLEKRLQALDDLKEIGFQTGTGIMVGSPYQRVDHIIEDIEYIEKFKPEMVGIGPFIPHHSTPFAAEAAGSVEQTLKLISIFRLINPQALIPATTALATLAHDGRERGILAGANVVMPNISPPDLRGNYSLYDNKAAFGSESGEGLRILKESLEHIGYSINFGRGDYRKMIKT
ncbi:MAG: [FeFe] hydrogenase H-cluster radical SAM maturase HydE [Rikenellaceae bacterium]